MKEANELLLKYKQKFDMKGNSCISNPSLSPIPPVWIYAINTTYVIYI